MEDGGLGRQPGHRAGSRETGLPEGVVRRVLSGALEASPWQGYRLSLFPRQRGGRAVGR